MCMLDMIRVHVAIQRGWKSVVSSECFLLSHVRTFDAVIIMSEHNCLPTNVLI